MTELVLIGGGGHARACLDVIRAGGRFQIAGILDRPELVGTDVLGVPVIGTDENLPALANKGMCFLIALGQIKTPESRIRLFGRLRELGAKLPAIVAPTAHVSPHALIGEGSIVMHMAVVGPGARIGGNCIINTRALVEHDSVIGDHCHVATGALVNGDCVVEQGVFIGSGAVLHQGVRIGERSVVGMGVMVRHDVAGYAVLRNCREAEQET
jgi:sugar O-acyltransferase (sialic acid O-acetyltransferase NeuD family)